MKAERSEIAPYDELSEDDVIALQVENERLRAALLLACRDGWSEEADKTMEHYLWRADQWLADG